MPFKTEYTDFNIIKERIFLKQIHYLVHYGVNLNSIATPKLRDIFTQSHYRKKIELYQDIYHTQLDYSGIQQRHNSHGSVAIEIVGENVCLIESSIVRKIVKEQQDLEFKTNILDSFEQLDAKPDVNPKDGKTSTQLEDSKTQISFQVSNQNLQNIRDLQILSLNHISNTNRQGNYSLDVFTVTTDINVKLSEIPLVETQSFSRLVDLVRTDNIYTHLEGEYVKSIVFDMIVEEFKGLTSKEIHKIFRSVFERELEGSQAISEDTVVIRALVDVKGYHSNLKLALLKKYTLYRHFDENRYVNKVFLLLVNPHERNLLNDTMSKLISTIRLFCDSLHMLSKDYSLEDVWELLAYSDWKYEALSQDVKHEK